MPPLIFADSNAFLASSCDYHHCINYHSYDYRPDFRTHKKEDSSMNILVVNDDGIESIGIRILASSLKKIWRCFCCSTRIPSKAEQGILLLYMIL